MKLSKFCDRIIEFSFYALFFFVPLFFLGSTSELFELNKMWLTFGLTIIIALFWIIKSIANKEVSIKRTPLDLPIFLFLISQIVSTIFSIDRHVSLWGYYSRFNGGLFSLIDYIFLYYAFAGNFHTDYKRVIKNVLGVSLFSGVVVALWGLPSHFGKDPTCLLFRGTFDVSCWTEDFQPKVRIFSTLGQPAWLAAYLAILLPISTAYALKKDTAVEKFFEIVGLAKKASLISFIIFTATSALFFVDILYTKARAGVIGMVLSLALFVAMLLLVNREKLTKTVKTYKKLWIIFACFIVIGFFAGVPLPLLDKISFDNLKQAFVHKTPVVQSTPQDTTHSIALGGTDSGKIRLIVWQGAIKAWLANPLFGTGVETFAYTYYKYRPAAHNLTSEWDFLYNKAHNEYLNYLATTGAFGLLTYLFIIALFLFKAKLYYLDELNFRPSFLNRFAKTDKETLELIKDPVNIALLAAFVSILITNFFGFSVVIINIYLFLIPLFFLANVGVLEKLKLRARTFGKAGEKLTPPQIVLSLIFSAIAIFLLMTLYTYWSADKSYALGKNLDQAQEYQSAYTYLHQAVAKWQEPVFQDEMAVNDSIMATIALTQQTNKNATQAATMAQNFVQESLNTDTKLVQTYPNNIVFWKSRVRIFYILGQLDPRYLPLALEAIKKAAALAPTDASISYNLGVLYGQNNDVENAIKTLENTVRLKPDYRNAYFALGVFYHELATNGGTKVVDKDAQVKANAAFDYILKNLNPKDTQVEQMLKTWQSS